MNARDLLASRLSNALAVIVSPAGTAHRYQLRPSSWSIDSTNFALATPVTLPAPLAGGNPKEATATGLAFITGYHCALWAVDDFNNPGPVSNDVFATTLGALALEMGPASVTLTLAADATGGAGGPARAQHSVRGPGPRRVTSRLALAHAGPVDVGLFDVRGRQVARLMSGWRPAGTHECEWSGLDDAGRRLPGGIYFALARTPDGTFTGRLPRVF